MPWLERITSKPGSRVPFLWSWVSVSFPDTFTDCHRTFIIPGKAQGFPETTELRCANKRSFTGYVHPSTLLGSRGPQPFWAPGTGFMQDNFSTDQGQGGGVVVVWGSFKCMTLIVHFISSIITSAPPQITRHWISEAGDPPALWHPGLPVRGGNEELQRKVPKSSLSVQGGRRAGDRQLTSSVDARTQRSE